MIILIQIFLLISVKIFIRSRKVTSNQTFHFHVFIFFRIRSKNGRTPANFGRYQRNLFTFTQSCVFFITYQFLLGMAYLIFLTLNIMEQPVEVISYFLFFYFLVLDIVKSVIIPLIIIKRSWTRLPQLFRSGPTEESRRSHFYVRRPNISPRHQVRMASMVSQEHNEHILLVKEFSDL